VELASDTVTAYDSLIPLDAELGCANKSTMDVGIL